MTERRSGKARGAQGPKSVGHYSLGQSIGVGGYGQVFQAMDQKDGAFVAIKQIPIGNVQRDQIAIIMQEIKLLQGLKNSKIVKYIESIKSSKYLWIVLEYIENGSVAQIIKRYGALSEEVCSIYIKQVLEGLIFLNKQGIVHRDIKGGNIMVTKEGHIKIGDFGVATSFKNKDAKDEYDVVGTPYWMAPEIIELEAPTPASDIWALGCTIIEFLTRHPPYYQLQPMQALFKIVKDAHPPLPEGISPQCRKFLLDCFQKDVGARAKASDLIKHEWIKMHNKEAQMTLITKDQFQTGGDGAELEPDDDDFGDDFDDFDVPGELVLKKKEDTPKAVEMKAEPKPEPKLEPKVADADAALKEVRLDDLQEEDTGADYTELYSEMKDSQSLQIKVVEDTGKDEFDEMVEDEEMKTLDRIHDDSNRIMNLISKLTPEYESLEDIKGVCDELEKIFTERPDQKQHIVTHHAVIPIMEMLRVEDKDVILIILNLINLLIQNHEKIQENLCMIGGISEIMRFSYVEYPLPVRLEASKFIKTMCHSSALTLQMFIASRGLPVLISLLDSGYGKEEEGDGDETVKHTNELVINSLDSITKVFELRTPTPKNDFGRLFARDGLFAPLLRALLGIAGCGESRIKVLYTKEICDLVLLFSQFDVHVRNQMSNKETVTLLLNAIKEVSMDNKVKLMKSIGFLVNDPTLRNNFEEVGVIEATVSLLDLDERENKFVAAIHEQAFPILFNMCYLSKKRQTRAVIAGAIPHLVKYAYKKRFAMRSFVIITLCTLAYAGWKEMSEKGAAQCLYDLMQSDTNWLPYIFSAMNDWMMLDPESLLKDTTDDNLNRIADVLSTSTHPGSATFVSLVEAIQNLVVRSPELGKRLSETKIISHILDQLNNPKRKSDTYYKTAKLLNSLVLLHPNPVSIKDKVLTRLRSVLDTCKKNNLVLVISVVEEYLIPFLSECK